MDPILEVVMRPPSVFVRELSPQEGERLRRMSKRAKHFSTRQRAAILLASATRHTVPQIASLWQTDESHVRRVIHDFNERGFDSLRPDYRGGRPRRITVEVRKRIVAVAGARPDTLGQPFTRWSLVKLAAYLRERGICEISPAHLGRVLAEAGLSFQRTRSWKASPDPDYEAKAARVLSLYERPPKDGAVISFDQMRPISLRPTHGSGWAQRRRPERHRATFNRRHGVRYGFGALDVHQDRLRLRQMRRRRGQDTLAFKRQSPALLPAPDPPLLDPGQPLGQLDPRHPHLRGGQQHRARAAAHLRQLPQPHRGALPTDHRVRRQQRRLPRLGVLPARARRPRPPPQRPRP
jgi:transposase